MRWSLKHFYKILRWHLVREYLEAFVHSVLKAEGRRIVTTKIHDCWGPIWIPQPNSNSSPHMRPFHEVKDICYSKICRSLSAVVAITKQRKHPTKHGKYGTLWTNNLNNIAYKQCLMSCSWSISPHVNSHNSSSLQAIAHWRRSQAFAHLTRQLLTTCITTLGTLSRPTAYKINDWCWTV